MKEYGVPRSLSLASKHSAKYRNPKGAAKYFAAYRFEVSKGAGKFFQKELNQKIWKGEELREEIRDKILEIVKLYEKHLGLDIKPKDIVITGSMANYNWSPQSDIDVHLIYDISQLGIDQDFIKEYLDAKEKQWKREHDISIHGYTVEMYPQDSKQKHFATGIFSVLNNDWVSRPQFEEVRIDKQKIKTKASKIAIEIEELEDIENDLDRYEAAKKIKAKIKKMRQAGLSKEGEFSEENLVFKTLRNTGHLKKLFDVMSKSLDKHLSIEEIAVRQGTIEEKSVSKSQQRLFGMVKAYKAGNLIKDKLPKNLINKIKDIANSMSDKEINKFASTKRSKLPEKIDEEFNIKPQKNILAIQKGIDGFDEEKIELTKEFIKFCCKKLKIESPVTVVLRKGRDEYIHSTASYIPSLNQNHIRAGGRALVDIFRSIGHELVHNRQRELGIFDLGDKVQNIGGSIEDQANALAGVLIKDFCINHGFDRVYEF